VVSPTRSSEDIAGPAVFLASDLSVYVTGHIIMAEGGCRTVWLSRASRAKVMAKEEASVRTSSSRALCRAMRRVFGFQGLSPGCRSVARDLAPSDRTPAQAELRAGQPTSPILKRAIQAVAARATKLYGAA
jgi:hypothetical protein